MCGKKYRVESTYYGYPARSWLQNNPVGMSNRLQGKTERNTMHKIMHKRSFMHEICILMFAFVVETRTYCVYYAYLAV